MLLNSITKRQHVFSNDCYQTYFSFLIFVWRARVSYLSGLNRAHVGKRHLSETF